MLPYFCMVYCHNYWVLYLVHNPGLTLNNCKTIHLRMLTILQINRLPLNMHTISLQIAQEKLSSHLTVHHLFNSFRCLKTLVRFLKVAVQVARYKLINSICTDRKFILGFLTTYHSLTKHVVVKTRKCMVIRLIIMRPIKQLRLVFV